MANHEAPQQQVQQQAAAGDAMQAGEAAEEAEAAAMAAEAAKGGGGAAAARAAGADKDGAACPGGASLGASPSDPRLSELDSSSQTDKQHNWRNLLVAKYRVARGAREEGSAGACSVGVVSGLTQMWAS
jgi:hypothetical protein